jgi:hypothetical protein
MSCGLPSPRAKLKVFANWLTIVSKRVVLPQEEINSYPPTPTEANMTRTTTTITLLAFLILCGCSGGTLIVPCDSWHQMEADKELLSERLDPWRSQMNAHPDQQGAILSICGNQVYEGKANQCWMTLP